MSRTILFAAVAALISCASAWADDGVFRTAIYGSAVSVGDAEGEHQLCGFAGKQGKEGKPSGCRLTVADALWGCSNQGCGCDDKGGCDSAKCSDSCDFGGGLACFRNGETPLSIWIWTGPTSFTSAFESENGWSEGANLGLRITDGIGAYASVGFNHTQESTQILRTFGLQKFGNPDGAGILERASVWVLWDQASDSRIDDVTFDQLRFTIGYATGERSEIGMGFSVPTSDDLGGFAGGALSPIGGPGYMSSSTSFVGPYIKRRYGNWDITGTIGYSEGASGLAVGGSAETALTERTNLYIDGKLASGDIGAVSAGVAIPFGAADTKWH